MRRPNARARSLASLPACALLLALSLVLSSAGSAHAGPPPAEPGSGPDQATDSASVVRAELRPSKLTAAPGAPVVFDVILTIADGWHLYAHGDTSFYGIALKGLEKGPLAGAAIAYPSGKKADFFGTPVELLTGRQLIHVKGALSAGTSGKLVLPIGVEVQACDDQRCLAPATVPLKLRLEAVR